MICWACERATEPTSGQATCSFCGVLLPVDQAADHFSVFGLPRRHDLDTGALEARYRELTRKLHPDRFAKADPRERRASLGRSVQLNDAWRTLKDPVKRAEYLLGLLGVEVAPEAGGKVPAELLAEILELREALGEARLGGDDATVQKMAAEMRQRVAASVAAVGDGLSKSSLAPETAGGLEAVARELVALRYYRRFLDEVEVHDEAALARGEARHG
ncbi:MAG TPA: Fe-S protein assembly co-chaperone HscB [Polyangia bacterium]|jgi:molecular chaperone HscB|nr:Fe-S protein assembly co-chaperone HscB [Polyangia bacterium]